MKPILIPLLAFAPVLAAACDVQPTAIDLDLYGSGAGFEGLYAVDGSDADVSFESSETTSNVHTYGANLKIEESLRVDVFPDPSQEGENETDMTSLTCRVSSKDGAVLYEETYQVDSTTMKTFTYEIQ